MLSFLKFHIILVLNRLRIYIICEEASIFAPQRFSFSGNRRLYPLKGTSFDRVYVCL